MPYLTFYNASSVPPKPPQASHPSVSKAGGWHRAFNAVYQPQQGFKLSVAAAGGADVVDKTWRVGQVLRFAIAQSKPRKDARHDPLDRHGN